MGVPKPNPSPPPPPKPSPYLSEPWREIKWGDTEDDLQYVKNYKPQNDGQLLRILLHGPAGAGKSSFINSVQSVLRGKTYVQALVDNTGHDSFTRKYTTYKIPKRGPKTFYPFVFNDIMGLEKDRGVKVNDIILAMRGRVKDGYMFDPDSALTEDNKDFYNRRPRSNDKVHVLVCVVPADAVSLLTDETVKKIREIRMEASNLGIPQVVILTKIDLSCPEIREDLKDVYKMKYVKEKMEEFSAKVGIPMNCIFPVKNYDKEIGLNSDVNSLILSVLRRIIDFGEDGINFHKDSMLPTLETHARIIIFMILLCLTCFSFFWAVFVWFDMI